MSKSSQLLAALQSGRTVTRGTAMLSFKIANLTAEIGTLRRRGHNIVAVTGDDGTGASYTKWVYVAPTTAGIPSGKLRRNLSQTLRPARGPVIIGRKPATAPVGP